MHTQLHRRQFLQTAAVAGASASWLAGPAPAGSRNANERIRVGIIGVGGRGVSNWRGVAAAGAEVVALCDVDDRQTGRAREAFPKAAFFKDYRKLIDAGGIDAVVISTPDHAHALPTLQALRADLHVYCEKPLTHTVEEARLVAETAKQRKRVTQMGTQIHAGNNYRRVVELIQSGAIGKVGEVHVWCGKTWSIKGDRPKETPPVPAGLDYDLWVGPAPYRPYHPAYLPARWRNWWDFGGGTMNDMACHHMDLSFWALKLRHPVRVSAEGTPVHPEVSAQWIIATYDFPARGDFPPVTLKWYDGGKRPDYFAKAGLLPKWGDGTLFVGDQGMLLADYGKYRLLPEDKFRDFKRPEPFIPNSVGHYREWLDAIRDGGETTCNFDYSGALTETVLLGSVAYRSGEAFDWDGASLTPKNAPKAKTLVGKEYRKGWSLS